MRGDEDGDILQCGMQTSAAVRKAGRERMRHAPLSSQQSPESTGGWEAGEEQGRNAETEKERLTKPKLLRDTEGTVLQIQQKCKPSL